MKADILAFDGIGRTSDAFRAELVRLAMRLGLDWNGIAAVMSVESGFDHTIRNQHCLNVLKRSPSQCATGLIQFMPETAKLLGTTVDELAQMSAVEQLRYVEKFYRPTASRIKTRGDYYMATFMPAFVGSPPSTVLGQKDAEGAKGKIYSQNAGLDKDKNGTITVADVTRTIEAAWTRALGRTPVSVDIDHPIIPLPGAPDPLVPAEEVTRPVLSSLPPSPPPSSGSLSFEPRAVARHDMNADLPTLSIGSYGTAVKLWCRIIGFEEQSFYDLELKRATVCWQEQRNLKPDGIVGPKTWGVAQ